MNCGCDEKLASTLAALAPSVYSNNYFDFDHANDCKVSSNNGDAGGSNETGNDVHECCGSYPTRFQFSTQGGARACCGDVTYGTNKHECCSGSLKDLGTCSSDIFDTDDEGSGFLGPWTDTKNSF